jgi:hypothetical protein
MHIVRDPIFDLEARRFGFVFCCEDCGHFDPGQESCRHEWPTENHRRARYLAEVTHIVFCKEFEPC